jgi:hypothetical protein
MAAAYKNKIIKKLQLMNKMIVEEIDARMNCSVDYNFWS